MPRTYEPIASQTVSTSTATVTFSNIPGTYIDLVIVALVEAATSGSALRWRVNSDTGSNYSATYLLGDSRGALSGRESSATSGICGFADTGSSADPTNVAVIHFMYYANTNVYKTVLHGGASNAAAVDRCVSLWRSTSAITSISLAMGATFPTYNFDTATISLYGVKAA